MWKKSWFTLQFQHYDPQLWVPTYFLKKDVQNGSVEAKFVKYESFWRGLKYESYIRLMVVLNNKQYINYMSYLLIADAEFEISSTGSEILSWQYYKSQHSFCTFQSHVLATNDGLVQVVRDLDPLKHVVRGSIPAPTLCAPQVPGWRLVTAKWRWKLRTNIMVTQKKVMF